MAHPFAPQPCAGCIPGSDEHLVIAASEPCDTFVSQGFGIHGDFEHSLFCSTCGFERGDHYCGHGNLPSACYWCSGNAEHDA